MHKNKLELNHKNKDNRIVVKQSYLDKAKKVKATEEKVKCTLPPGWNVLPIKGTLDTRYQENAFTFGMGKLVSTWVSNGLIDENDIISDEDTELVDEESTNETEI
jgi:hypothetical protein